MITTTLDYEQNATEMYTIGSHRNRLMMYAINTSSFDMEKARYFNYKYKDASFLLLIETQSRVRTTLEEDARKGGRLNLRWTLVAEVQKKKKRGKKWYCSPEQEEP